MKEKAEMTREELIALGWIKKPSDKMQEKAEKQLTAVEFIVEQLAKNGVLHSSDIAKAKEMEKEQIKKERVEAYNNGYANGQNDAYAI